jgi:hypothetical protein
LLAINPALVRSVFRLSNRNFARSKRKLHPSQELGFEAAVAPYGEIKRWYGAVNALPAWQKTVAQCALPAAAAA